MKRSFIALKLIGTLTIGLLAGAALGVLFANNKESATRKEIAKNAKDLVKNLSKKAKKKVKRQSKEAWLEKEKGKIMSDVK
jgi:gas vesicle protein